MKPKSDNNKFIKFPSKEKFIKLIWSCMSRSTRVWFLFK